MPCLHIEPLFTLLFPGLGYFMLHMPWIVTLPNTRYVNLFRLLNWYQLLEPLLPAWDGEAQDLVLTYCIVYTLF